MSLQSAMDAAKEAANQVPAVQDTQGALAPMSFGTSLDDFLSGGMQVDAWVQVKDGGIRLNRDEKAYIEEFEAELDLNTVQLFHGVRAEFAGNKVEYAKSFASVCAHYKANSVKPANPYRGADMVLVLTKDVVQGKTTIPAGTRIGYTTPITGFAPFQTLLKGLAAEGKLTDAGGGRLTPTGENPTVKLVHERRTNDQNQDYGVLLMELTS
jgi:hypothetical protein